MSQLKKQPSTQPTNKPKPVCDVSTSEGIIGKSTYKQWAEELKQIYDRASKYFILDSVSYHNWLTTLIETYSNKQMLGSDRIAAFM